MRRCVAAFFSWLEYSDYIEKSPARRIKQIKNDMVSESVIDGFRVASVLHLPLKSVPNRKKTFYKRKKKTQ